MARVTCELALDDSVTFELDYLVELQIRYARHNAEMTEGDFPALFTTREELVRRVLKVIAEGARRPGSWERGVLEQLDLVPMDHELGVEACELSRYRLPGRREPAIEP